MVMFDADPEVARRASDRINSLARREVACPQQLDVRDQDALVAALAPLGVVVCAVPFPLIPACTRAAIEAHTGMVDLGGHTDTVLGQLALDEDARTAGIGIVPDCGMGPGLNNTLGMYLIESLEAAGATPVAVRLYDGGLPVDRSCAWGYRSTFHINGLTNEYDGEALFLRGGRVTQVATLTEAETLEFADLGPLEAFVTSGGTSTVPLHARGSARHLREQDAALPRPSRRVPCLQGAGALRRVTDRDRGLSGPTPRALPRAPWAADRGRDGGRRVRHARHRHGPA